MTFVVLASNAILGRVLRLAFPLPLILLAWVSLSTVACADVKDDIGYTQLLSVLGGATPNGAGVPISMVEALRTITNDNGTPEPGDDFVSVRSYKPDPSDPLFTSGSDPLGQSVLFTDGSNNNCGGVTEPCIGFSSHATSTVGSRYFGNTVSLAQAANEVTLYEATDWINDVLNLSSGLDPLPQNFRVQNFSWVGSVGSDTLDRNTLRRFDYLIDRDNVTAFVGLNNDFGNTGTVAQPQLLVHSYNAIAVGRTDGLHSTGPTTLPLYGTGRIKPDIVVPITTTSAATAYTSSAATMLHEVVAGTNAADAANSEVMKAMLLAGATKEDIPGWSRTMTSQPLDSRFGAGELNVYNSYLMTQGGQTVGSIDNTGASVNTVTSFGWDYQTVSPDSPGTPGDLFYNFEISASNTAARLSIVLAWNVEVTDTNSLSPFVGDESLANLDLTLYDSSASFLDFQIDESISAVDNVEHIYQPNLGPGTYTLKVSTDSMRDFGLAWRTSIPSADFDLDGDVDGTDFLTLQLGFGTGATYAEGDADGDGDIDSDDMLVLNSEYGSTTGTLLGVVVNVPEPSTVGLALLAAAFLPLLFRAERRSAASEI